MRLLIFLLLASLPLSAQYTTNLVADLNPGIADALPFANEPAAALGDNLVFAARTPETGAEVWFTDGTAEGTRLLLDVNPGTAGSDPDDFYSDGSRVYFTATTPATGREVYVSDGTPAGTMLLADVRPGTSSSIIGGTTFIAWNGAVYFVASGMGSSYFLYRTDGTPAGTVLFDDINTNGGSDPQYFATTDDHLYFVAFGPSGYSIYRTDGTTTTAVATPPTLRNPEDLVVMGDHLYFTNEEGFSNRDLWRLPLAAPNTPEEVYDFPSRGMNLSTNTRTSPIAVLGDTLLVFSAEDGTTGGPDVWVSDGTTAGTRVVLDVPEAGGFGAYTPQQFVVAAGLVFYKDENETDGIELWRTDGTTDGTFQLADFRSGILSSLDLPSFFAAFDDQLFVGARNDLGTEVYRTDGSPNSFTLVTDLQPGAGSSRPEFFTMAGDRLFFYADNFDIGRELYVLSAPPAVQPLTGRVDSVRSVACFGGATGGASFTVTGGVGPYVLNGETAADSTFTLTDLPAGDYTYEITDARDSTLTVSLTIAQPSELLIEIGELTGQNSIDGGRIALVPTGGTAPYRFTWADTTITDSLRTDLAFGDYTATLTDANGCTVTETFVVEDRTSVPEIPAGALRVYPTVVTSQLHIETDHSVRIRKVVVYDGSGRRVMADDYPDVAVITLPRSRFPGRTGAFIVVLHGADGRRAVRRIVTH